MAKRPTLLVLDRSVQFLYEGQLAILELDHLGGSAIRRDERNWRDVWAELNGTADSIVSKTAYFGEVAGEKSVYSQLIRPGYQGGSFNRTRSANQYLTHWFYPYRGKFHPQMVRALLNILQVKPGSVVGDFFSGSGTTALEASLLGATFLGSDISPLCVLLTEAKAQSVHGLEGIRRRVEHLLDRQKLDPGGIEVLAEDERELVFLKVATLITLSDTARRRRDPEKSLRRNLAAMLRSVEDHAQALAEFQIDPGDVHVQVADARDLGPAGIAAGTVDVIVTSPPYSIALDYVENDEHALSALDVDVNELRGTMTGVRGRTSGEKLALYNEDMKRVFKETARILVPGGKAAFVVGDATVDGREWTTTEAMVGWAQEAGLRLHLSMDKIVFGLYSVMKDEKILVFEKEETR